MWLTICIQKAFALIITKTLCFACGLSYFSFSFFRSEKTVLKMSFICVKDFHRAPLHILPLSALLTCVWRHKTRLLSRQKYASRDKIMFVLTKTCLSQQKCVCCNKTFVATSICHNKHNFVATSILLLRQTCVCHDKTHLLLGQKYACHDKYLLRQTKYFVMLLSQQKMCFVVTNTCCHDKHVYFCHNKNDTCGSSHQ